MKRIAQLMTTDVATIGPDANVAEGMARMLERDVRGLPVLDGDHVVGVVTLTDLVRQPPYRRIRDVMQSPAITIGPAASISEAHQVMQRHRIGRLPVAEGGRLVGIVTAVDILQEMGKLTDPLTDLPWSGSLREAAVDLLREGHEIAILFLDLDNFGAVNKIYGHVVGDQVILEVARVLREAADSITDAVFRYAGDEFAILTTRPSADSAELAAALRDRIALISIGPVPPGAVVGSLGIAGGKRTTERADIHYQATVDDLITLASRASTIAKRTPARVLHGHELTAELERMPEAAAERVRLGGVFLALDGLRARATVELAYRGESITGERVGTGIGRAGLRLVAEATLDGLGAVLPAAWEAVVEDVVLTSLDGGHVVTVALALGGRGEPESLIGSVFAPDDMWAGAARATLKALNRRLESLTSHAPESFGPA